MASGGVGGGVESARGGVERGGGVGVAGKHGPEPAEHRDRHISTQPKWKVGGGGKPRVLWPPRKAQQLSCSPAVGRRR